MKILLTIYDAFENDNKGTVATGRNEKEVIQLLSGTAVILKTRDEMELKVKVLEVEVFTKFFSASVQMSILFGNQIKANVIPRETELWQ